MVPPSSLVSLSLFVNLLFLHKQGWAKFDSNEKGWTMDWSKKIILLVLSRFLFMSLFFYFLKLYASMFFS
ncbi:hypothetical protein GLYMA_18G291451v4 [Glycine max]|nr:hypothetical protein JHK86_051751 [Glycine max]KAH1156668.1 hypothetical protein GYH30_051460 [Glycine max]KRH01731.2 hypothetical protein GLYMA_18G291451v4 [Glycine max]